MRDNTRAKHSCNYSLAIVFIDHLISKDDIGNPDRSNEMEIHKVDGTSGNELDHQPTRGFHVSTRWAPLSSNCWVSLHRHPQALGEWVTIVHKSTWESISYDAHPCWKYTIDSPLQVVTPTLVFPIAELGLPFWYIIFNDTRNHWIEKPTVVDNSCWIAFKLTWNE